MGGILTNFGAERAGNHPGLEIPPRTLSELPPKDRPVRVFGEVKAQRRVIVVKPDSRAFHNFRRVAESRANHAVGQGKPAVFVFTQAGGL